MSLPLIENFQIGTDTSSFAVDRKWVTRGVINKAQVDSIDDIESMLIM